MKPMDQRAAVVDRPTTFSVPLTSPVQHQYQTQVQHQRPTQLVPVSAVNVGGTSQDAIASDAQSRMEQSLKRSVTLVFWYKSGAEPIRLHQEIPTFPLFQLSQFAQLVSDLGLSSSVYVDSYNPHACTWEQQTITTVRVIGSEQRLLYRTRRSLLEGMPDNECPGLPEEINMQLPGFREINNLSLKRPATDTTEPGSQGPAIKYYRAESYVPPPGYIVPLPYAAANTQAYPQSLSAPQTPANPSPQSPTTPRQPPYTPSSAPTQYTPPASGLSPSMPPAQTQETHQSPSSSTATYPPHPPLKRWPNDYTVSEIAAGFREMDSQIAQSPTLTQKAAFERVFGCRYIKSTVCRHRGVWKRAEKGVREAWEGMGGEAGCWGDFVKRVEGRGRDGHGQSGQVPVPVLTLAPVVGQKMEGAASVPVSVSMAAPPQVEVRQDEAQGADKSPAMASLGPPSPPPQSVHPGKPA